MPALKPRLIVMVKEPRPGRVKTRLGRDIGMVPAAWWFRHQTRSLFRRLQSPRWDLILAVTPDREGLRSRVWPGTQGRIAQGPGDLGDRMRRVMAAAKGPVCVVGSDIPGLEAPHVARAFRALGSRPAVFGPAPDGGYWLVGLRHPQRAPRGFLQNVRWSGPQALEDSVASLGNLPCAFVDTLKDVDEAHDLP